MFLKCGKFRKKVASFSRRCQTWCPKNSSINHWIRLIYKLNYLITFSMEQSPSWEAKRFSGSQEILRISCNPMLNYRIHNWLPTEPARSSPYTHTSIFLKIYLHIVLPSSPGSSRWTFSLRFPHQDPLYASPHTRYIPVSFFSILLPKNIGLAVQIIKLFIMLTSPFPCHLNPLTTKYSPGHPILRHPQPNFLLQCEQPSFTPIQNNRLNYSSLYLNL